MTGWKLPRGRREFRPGWLEVFLAMPMNLLKDEELTNPTQTLLKRGVALSHASFGLALYD
jgi:hypothetical protein